MGSFTGCTGLKSVTFNSRLKYIGVRSFKGSGVETIKWPETIDPEFTAMSQIFSDCNNLTEVTVPGFFTTIPEGMFMNCKGLEKCTIGYGVETVGKNSFYNCQNLQNVVFAANEDGSVPSKVKVLDQLCFGSTTNLHSITLPEGLQEISGWAFSSSGLYGITIPESVELIGGGAFMNCRSLGVEGEIVFPRMDSPASEYQIDMRLQGDIFLNCQFTEFTFPRWMTYVPKSFFMGCNKLRSVTFSTDGVTEIGDRAFSQTYLLQIGMFPSTVTSYGEESFKESGKDLPIDEYLGTLVVNGGKIGKNAFAGAKLNGLDIIDCAEFGQGAFQNVKYIETLSIPACMTEIPAQFCQNWEKLHTVSFADPSTLLHIKDYAFSGCKVLKNFPLQEMTSLKRIGTSAFSNSGYSGTGGKLILPPQPLEFISDNSSEASGIFSGCKGITSFDVPANMDKVPYSFLSASGLVSLTFEEREGAPLGLGRQCFGQTQLTEVTLPETDMTFENGVFGINSLLTTVNWPESADVTINLGKETFSSCPMLEMETLHPSITVLPSRCFYRCTALKDMTLPSVTTVMSEAFQECKNLRSVTFLSDNVRAKNADNVFKDCHNLTTVTMPNAFPEIGASFFTNCYNLTGFEFTGETPGYTNSIGAYAFMNCVSLTSLPDEMTSRCYGTVSERAFINCHNLETLNLPMRLDGEFHFSMYNSLNIDGTTYPIEPKLQSINFTNQDDEEVYISHNTFAASVPMRKLSYLMAEVPKDIYRSTYPLTKESTHPEKIKLMVKRGNRWKLMARGLDRIFDIEEVKDPATPLLGELRSTFDAEKNVNHYFVRLRWQVELSDLNDKEGSQTVYHIFRDGKEIVTVRFDAPVEETSASDHEMQITRHMKRVGYHLIDPATGKELEKSVTSGDFYYRDPKKPGMFREAYMPIQDNLWFDYETHERLGVNNGSEDGKSWFVFTDRFDSEPLESFDIPDTYTYSMYIDGYDYRKPENREVLPESGPGWEYRDASLPERIDCGERTVFASFARPSLKLQGMYSTEEVKADQGRTLAPTPDIDQNADYGLAYEIPGEGASHRMAGKRLNDGTYDYGEYIVSDIKAYKFDSRDADLETARKWGDLSPQGQKTGTIDGDPGVIDFGNTTFQMVTTAGYRGTFGSPRITVYNVPSFSVSINEAPKGVDYWLGLVEVKMKALYNLEPLGYPEGKKPRNDQYFMGVWQNIHALTTDAPAEAPMYAESTGEEPTPTDDTLIWHHDGLKPYSWGEAGDQHHSVMGYDYNSDVYTDRLALPSGPKDGNYTMRMYVQLPDNPDQWMVKDDKVSIQDIVTSTGEVKVQAVSLERMLREGRLYNLQGTEIRRPEPGQIFIGILDGVSYKLVMPDR